MPICIATAITGVLLHILWEPAGEGQTSAAADWTVGPGWFAVRF